MYLACSNGEVFGPQLFLVQKNRRHYVRDASVVTEHGFRWPEDVRNVTDEHLLALRPAQWAPRKWPEDVLAAPPASHNSHEMREAIAGRLSGVGLEIGPYDSPFPVPVDCDVIYVDLQSHEQIMDGVQRAPSVGQSFVIPVLKARFETLDVVQPRSLDFFIASHVIEHTRDPIGCILNALSKLRPGGSLILVVPDKLKTFDKDRPLTGLDHLVQDYEDPSRERDKENFREYVRFVAGIDGTDLEDAARKLWLREDPIHFHTWTYESFGECIEWISRRTPLAKIASYPTRQPDGFEFYYRLEVG